MHRPLASGAPYSPHYPYIIRGFPDTAALENRQTLLNDYITSQQMHQWPAAAAMAAQRSSDIMRGIPSRDQAVPLPYPPRGKANTQSLTESAVKCAAPALRIQIGV